MVPVHVLGMMITLPFTRPARVHDEKLTDEGYSDAVATVEDVGSFTWPLILTSVALGPTVTPPKMATANRTKPISGMTSERRISTFWTAGSKAVPLSVAPVKVITSGLTLTLMS